MNRKFINAFLSTALLSSAFSSSNCFGAEVNLTTTIEPSASSMFTADPYSEAGKLLRQGGLENLKKAAELKSSYAAYELYRDFPSPETRNILFRTVLEKLKEGHTVNLNLDLDKLGHYPLKAGCWSLKGLLGHIENAYEIKKPSLYHYLYSGSWSELGFYITDFDKSSEYIASARKALEDMAQNNDHRSKIYLGKIALDENDLNKATENLLDKDLLPLIVMEKGYNSGIMTVDTDWLAAIKDLIQKLSTHNQHEIYFQAIPTLVNVLKNAHQYEEGFHLGFDAYKKARNLKMSSAETLPFYSLCHECIEIKQDTPVFSYESFSERKKRLDSLKKEKAQCLYFGYQLHSYLAEQWELENDEIGASQESETANSYLRRSILEGNQELLETLLLDSNTLFPTPFDFIQFLSRLIEEEWVNKKSHKRNMFCHLTPELSKEIQNKLVSCFSAADSDNQIKELATISMFMIFDEKIKQKISSYDVDLVSFWKNQTEMHSFMRQLQLDPTSSNYEWAKNIQKKLEQCYLYGVYYNFKATYPPYSSNYTYIIEPYRNK